MTMTLIETKTLASAAASIEFTSIPQDGTDLVVLVSGRSARALVIDGVGVYFNGSTTGYTGRRLFGSGSSVGSDTTYLGMPWMTAANATSNTFGNAAIYIPNYTGSTNKSFSIDGVGENNATDTYQGIGAGLWSNTAAITSLAITGETSTNLQIGTTISLYKITKGSDGIVTTS
jgi:hypothetical protein